MRKIHYLIIVLFCCVVPSIAMAQDTYSDYVESSCIARISTGPSLGLHSAAARSGGHAGMGLGGGNEGGMMGGGYGGEMVTFAAPNHSIIVDLIESYPVSGRAAREVFGKTLTELAGDFSIKIYQTTPEVAMIGLHVGLEVQTSGRDDDPQQSTPIGSSR